MFDHNWILFKKFALKFTQAHKRTVILRYGFPVLLILILIILKVTLYEVFGEQIRYHTITLVVILSAWYGGLGPGLFATVLSGIVNNFFFMLPNTTFLSTDNIIALGIFMIVGITVSMLSEARRQTDLQKDEFIGMISHEVKTPLTAIKTYTQLLTRRSKQKKDKDISDYTSKIDIQTNSIITIINDLLDITRIATGELSFHNEMFAIYALLKQCVEEQQLVNEKHKIIFTGISVKKLFADKQRIRQVITNLLTNAIKYSLTSDTIEVTIQDKNTGVEISVKDYGIGIPKEQQKYVFERFFRSNNVKKQRIKGLGLGLYISSQIVKKYKGNIRVKSIPNKYTIFYLFLPDQKFI